MTTPAAPGEVHPAYTKDARWIKGWLDGDRLRDRVQIPFRAPVVFSLDDNPEPVAPAFKTHTLTRRTAAGPAPWVGCPFFYTWYVAEDELHRMVAAESSRIVWTCTIATCAVFPEHTQPR